MHTETKLNKKLVTHNGSFHTDDIFAAAAISILLERNGETYEIIRTRDPEIIKNGDYVFDVGGIYDEEENKFDHHQVGGAGKGPQDIEYSSFGLVWKKFGAELCGNEKAAGIIQKKLVAPIDAHDNGFDLVTNKYEVTPYIIQNMFFAMYPTLREASLIGSEPGENIDMDEIFLKCVEIAKPLLLREIIQAKDALLAEEKVIEIYKNTQDKRIIILDKNYPFDYTRFPEPLFVVYPRKGDSNTDDTWGVKAVLKEPKTFNNRKNLPNSWAGLRDEELQKITGVSDAIFCHRALYFCIAKSKEGAMKLAQIAVES